MTKVKIISDRFTMDVANRVEKILERNKWDSDSRY